MLSKEDWMKIKTQAAKGVYHKDIAHELGVHPKTVSRALKRGSAPEGKRPRARKSKLDPFKPFIDELLKEQVWNAVVIFREIQARGYDGGITIVRDYIHHKRPLRQSRATVRFETAPGRQMQSDWGEIWRWVAGEKTKVFFIVNTLGYSRRFHFWCAERNDAEHTYEGIVRSFEYFGGTTREVLVDNQKAAVVRHVKGDGVRFNRRFLDLAACYGFTPKACRPYRAQTKGKGERMVGYIKNHFFLRYRRFDSWAHLNTLALEWLAKEADVRVHGTIKEKVLDRFEKERKHLGPLPYQRYDTSYREQRRVHWDGYIEVRGNRYSVPAEFCGERVTVRIGLDGLLRVFDAEETLVATHRMRSVSEGWVTTPEHHQPLWDEVFKVETRNLSTYEEMI